MPSQVQEGQIASYLLAHPPFPLRAESSPPYVQLGLAGYGPPPRPSAEELGRFFFQDAEFRALELGTWLGTTDGEIFAGAVERFLPPLYRQDAELLVDALKFAADLQQAKGREVAGKVAIGSIGVAIVVAIGIRSARPNVAV